MLDLDGRGVLALWNGVDPDRKAEYDLWHTREHVPERISVPGMLGARRYARLDGPLPEYLTLYMLENTGVLTSEPYRNLLNNPTPWSRSMRPSFRGFTRLCCERCWSSGGGAGGWLAAVPLDEAGTAAWPAIARALGEAPDATAMVAAHILLRDPNVPDVPFAIGGETPGFPRDGAVLLEFFADPIVPAVRDLLAAAGVTDAGEHLTVYRLAYALDRASLDRLKPPSDAA